MSDNGKGQIEGAWINDMLRAVTALTDNGDEQLSILARALVVGCKSCGVDKDRTVEIVTALFDEQTTLVPFATLRTEAARAEEREVIIEICEQKAQQLSQYINEHLMRDGDASAYARAVASGRLDQLSQTIAAIRARKAQPEGD